MLAEDQVLDIIEAVHAVANPDACLHITNVKDIWQMLLTTPMDLEGLMPWSSNYTFLSRLDTAETTMLGVYKPSSGERPLWDFPDGHLCHREFCSYLVSHVLGWPNIPPTVLRDGPHGWGSVQLFVEAEYEAHYFNMRDSTSFTEEFRQIALFDYIVNNADRKGGHCLKGRDDILWAIDHGLTFHSDFKLRTVIWEFCNESIPTPLLNDLSYLQKILDGDMFSAALSKFITKSEVKAFKKRLGKLLTAGQLPGLHPGRNVPFPPV